MCVRKQYMSRSVVRCVVLVLVVGCGVVEQDTSKGEREKYVAYLQGIIADAKKDADFFIGHTLTDSEERYKREMVYLDERYLSYRIEEYTYSGGAHGSTKVSVGTLDRETGRQLTLVDVFGKDGLAALAAELRKAVIAKIGEENIQSPVKPTENFYIASDGWHFVYNEYEIACHALGVVEVVLKPSREAVASGRGRKVGVGAFDGTGLPPEACSYPDKAHDRVNCV